LVYRPCTRGHMPSNATWMLLASAIGNELIGGLMPVE
jgi:hypothetical protein